MIELIPFQRSHFDLLIEWSPSPKSLLQWSGAGFTYPLDHEQLNKLLAAGQGSPPRVYLYAARRVSDGAIVGHGEIGFVDRQNLNARLMRIIVSRTARGRGLGEGVVRELVRVGFGELRLHRLDLNVFDFNRAAIRCYERVGFRLEGTLREARRHNDEYWNVCTMGLLRSEWEAV